MKRKMDMQHWWNDTDREKLVPLPLCPPAIPHNPSRPPQREAGDCPSNDMPFNVSYSATQDLKIQCAPHSRHTACPLYRKMLLQFKKITALCG
jgi:hypothetical protein